MHSVYVSMLIIRNKQIELFKEHALRRFIEENVEHIQVFAQKPADALGETVLRQIVEKGIDRANFYGLSQRGPVQFYVEMMFLFGSDFDTDPQYPWINKILRDPEIEDQLNRADTLYEKMMNYYEQVIGPDSDYEKKAIMRVSQMPSEAFLSTKGDLRHGMTAQLNYLYPEKCQYIGKLALDALIETGITTANTHGIFNSSGYWLFVGLMFIFGHGCFADLQFPWITGTLSNSLIPDTNKRIERLYLKMLTYLKMV